MNGKDMLLNLVSFGAYGRVKKSATRYKNVFSEYEECHDAHENHAAELSMAFVQLAEEKRSAYSEAKKNKEVGSELHVDEHHLAENEILTEDYSLKHIDGTVKGGEVALSTIAGAAVGAAAVFAVWTLAGRFGTAATGDTIAAFAGMERVKAAAVWLGGGLLPAHAGNARVGILVFAVLFFLPSLLVSSGIFRFFANRKIEKTEEATGQAEEVIRRIKEDLPRLETLKDQAKGMIKTVQESKKVFLEWYEVCCMSEAQRKEKLKILAASMLEIINTPLSVPPAAFSDTPADAPLPDRST